MGGFKTVSFDEAIEKTLELAKNTPLTEWIDIDSSLGRVLAKDITCIKNLPAFNNSAMDGFGIKHSDLGKSLHVKDIIYAGMDIEASLSEGECYKIMTGAKAPSDIDTIVPFENAISYDEENVKLPTDINKGNALRLKGEEQELGSIILKKGELLNSQSIAMLSSQGITKIPAYKKISIAVFSTGDELKEPWEKTNDSQIYNINSSALISLLKEHRFEADYCGVIPDSLDKSIDYFAKMKKYDVLITSGGISMGEADFIEEALIKNGFKESFHGINIKPGKPTMIGSMDDTVVCSMPGNPLAAYVNTFLFLIPLLKKIQGSNKYLHKKVLAKNQNHFKTKSGRSNIVLGNLKDTSFYVTGENKYGSGMITPLVQSNSIIVTDEKTSEILEEELIEIYLL